MKESRKSLIIQKITKKKTENSDSVSDYLNFIQDTYINAIKGLAKDIGCNYYYLKGNIFDEYDRSIDDSLEARDLLHDTVDQHNFLYEKFRELYVK